MPMGIYKRTEKHREIARANSKLRPSGFRHSEETKLKISKANKGFKQTLEMRTKSALSRTGLKRSLETKQKMAEKARGNKRRLGATNSPEHRRKIGEANKGENSSLWKGGISPAHRLIRASSQYKDWRSAVFRRDKWICQFCGTKHTTKNPLQADHIKPFALFSELRFDINNGRTLCTDCHRKTDTWGYKKIYQLEVLPSL